MTSYHCLPQAILAGAQSQSFQFQGLSFHGVNVCDPPLLHTVRSGD